jgi:hypothetical protein
MRIAIGHFWCKPVKGAWMLDLKLALQRFFTVDVENRNE